MGEALRRIAERGRRWRFAAALVVAAALVPASAATAQGQPLRLQGGRFTVEASRGDETLARSILAASVRGDTFPGLPRPRAPLVIQVAPDAATFRAWAGDGAPEWGAAFAIPEEGRILMQGRRASSQAGDPMHVLRHELAHLALHEYLGDLPPRWFDEGYASYAAGEWDREKVIATNLALAVRGVPSLAALDSGFYAGASRADASYAFAFRAVAELAELDPQRGLTLLLGYWREEGDFERALRRAYGLTQGEFERRFRDRTRRRYGALALFADVTIAALLIVFVAGPFYVIRRRRDKARLAAMRAADAEAERRERASTIDLLLRQDVPGGDV
ncbi:MAG TPA: hypothetical protein PKC83_07520, partial [Gemmatimonadaceae bacterium]|nr:hypothetical protein [Gemmatimonadaceae bacterium]